MFASPVEVSTACRLHFGMFSFGHPGRRQYGGVGAMVGAGSLRLRVEPAARFESSGPLAGRVDRSVGRIAAGLGLPPELPCRIDVLAAPPEHAGLGTGTQLALALAAGLNAFAGRPPLVADQLAEITGRGTRSAIGTHGFISGGLLVEHGKLAGEPLSPLTDRVELPESWRFVLIGQSDASGLSGDDEERAFRELSPVAAATTERLVSLVEHDLLPAARNADAERFGESLYAFGHAAGLCFAERQGGAYAGPRVSELVDALRTDGVRGVGQSSWGPTVFALAANAADAARLHDRIQSWLHPGETTRIVAPANSGARIVRET